MRFHIYHADCIGDPTNCSYPHTDEITDADSLIAAVKRDYVCAEYKNSYRSNDNFIGSDCLPVDCDNDHTENPEDWIYPSDVAQAFPNVAFAVHYSRHHLKPKNGKPARPKFHVFFAIDPVADADQYSGLKKLINAIFPYFDTKALDAARFFYGTAAPKVEIFDGPMSLTTYLNDVEFDAEMGDGSYGSAVIPEGSRNATMSLYAGKILKRYGNTEEAHAHFLEYAQNCDPPLDSHELDTIWRSALRFYGKVAGQEDYIPPEQFNQELLLKPSDYSDVGQAIVLSREYSGKLRYSPSTDYLVYNGSFWEESKPIKRRGYTNEKMEERTGISSRMIQDYRKKKDSNITLQSVLALCIGLNLQPAFSYDLILKAGFNICPRWHRRSPDPFPRTAHGASGNGLQTARSLFHSSGFWATTWGRTTISW